MPNTVDALMVGVGDLRCDLGLELGSQDGDEPEFLDALDRIDRAAHANKLALLGFAMTPTILQRRLARGWRAFIIHSDGYGISKSGNESVESSIATAKMARTGANGASTGTSYNGSMGKEGH